MYPKTPDNHSKSIDPLLFEMMAPNAQLRRRPEQSSRKCVFQASSLPRFPFDLKMTTLMWWSIRIRKRSLPVVSVASKTMTRRTATNHSNKKIVWKGKSFTKVRSFEGRVRSLTLWEFFSSGNLLHGSLDRTSLTQLLNITQSVDERFHVDPCLVRF